MLGGKLIPQQCNTVISYLFLRLRFVKTSSCVGGIFNPPQKKKKELQHSHFLYFFFWGGGLRLCKDGILCWGKIYPPMNCSRVIFFFISMALTLFRCHFVFGGNLPPKNGSRVIFCLFVRLWLCNDVILCWRKFAPKELQHSHFLNFFLLWLCKDVILFLEGPPKNWNTLSHILSFCGGGN